MILVNFTPMSNNIIEKKCLNLLDFYTKILGVNEITHHLPNDKKNYTFQYKTAIKAPEKLLDQDKPKIITPMIEPKTIDELKKQILESNNNGFQKKEENFVLGEGHCDASLLILGDAPNIDDVQGGKPFMGVTGQLLDRMLSFININRDNCYLSNVTFWPILQNYHIAPEEISKTLCFVHQMIKLINPKIILTLGAIATNAILDKPQGITQLRGKFHVYPLDPNILVLPSFHPVNLLKSPQSKQLSWHDLLLLKLKFSEIGFSK